MWSRMNKQGKQYLTAVGRALPCDRAQKKMLLAELQDRVEEFTAQSPQADYDALCNAFGAPQTLAADYVGTQGDAALTRALSRRRVLLTVFAAVLLAALLLWGSMVLSLWREGHANVNGTVTEELIDGALPEQGGAQ